MSGWVHGWSTRRHGSMSWTDGLDRGVFAGAIRKRGMHCALKGSTPGQGIVPDDKCGVLPHSLCVYVFKAKPCNPVTAASGSFFFFWGGGGGGE